MHRHLRTGLAGLGLLALLLGACARSNQPLNLAPTPTSEGDAVGAQVIATVTRTADSPVPVSVASTKRGPISSTLVYSGHVQPAFQVDVAPRISGQVAQ